MTTIEAVKTDIKGAIGFLTNRGAINTSSIGDRLGQSISGKIMQVRSMSASEADEILVLLEGSPFPVGALQALTAAVESRLTSDAVGGPIACSLKSQLLTKCNLVFTAAEALSLTDKHKSWELKVDVVLTRFRKLGCVNPHEQTYKWLMALLLQSHFEIFPSYSTVFSLLNDLKMSFGTLSFHGYPFPYIAAYPESPSQLPAQQHEYAYAPDEPPVAMMPLRFVEVAHNHVPLRKNSKLLQERSRNISCDGGGSNVENMLGRVLQYLQPENISGKVQPRMLGSAVTDRFAICDGSAQVNIGSSPTPKIGSPPTPDRSINIADVIAVERASANLPPHVRAQMRSLLSFGDASSGSQTPQQHVLSDGSPKQQLFDDAPEQHEHVLSDGAPKHHVLSDDAPKQHVLNHGPLAAGETSPNPQGPQPDRFISAQDIPPVRVTFQNGPALDTTASLPPGRMDMLAYEQATFKALKDKADTAKLVAKDKKSKDTKTAALNAERDVGKTIASCDESTAGAPAHRSIESTDGIKRPAAAGDKSSKRRPAAAPLKRPVGCPRGPPMQTASGMSALHGRGKIYVSFPNHCFRVIRDASVGSTEVRVRWSGAKPDEAAWAVAIDVIDKYWDGKH
jgi:hypothetical protein